MIASLSIADRRRARIILSWLGLTLYAGRVSGNERLAKSGGPPHPVHVGRNVAVTTPNRGNGSGTLRAALRQLSHLIRSIHCLKSCTARLLQRLTLPIHYVLDPLFQLLTSFSH